MNKKIASEIAIGIILFVAVVIGVLFWMQGKSVSKIQNEADNKTVIQKPIQKEKETVMCTQDAKLCDNGKTYVSRTGPNCEFAPCSDLNKNSNNDVLARKDSDSQFSIDNIKFSMLTNWLVAKEENGKIYIKNLNYKSKYDVFLFPSRIVRTVMGGSAVFDKSAAPIKINGGEIFNEAIGGAFAGYVVDMNGFEYEIIWDIVGNELPPSNIDGLWTPSHGFTQGDLLEIMKTAKFK